MRLPEAFELEVGPTAQDDLQTLPAGPDSHDVLPDGVIIAGLARSGETCSAIGTPELLAPCRSGAAGSGPQSTGLGRAKAHFPAAFLNASLILSCHPGPSS
jgi:hypothetical protein